MSAPPMLVFRPSGRTAEGHHGRHDAVTTYSAPYYN